MADSILERVRQDATQKERKRNQRDVWTMKDMKRDEIAYEAKCEAWAEAPRRWIWFTAGFTFGMGVALSCYLKF